MTRSKFKVDPLKMASFGVKKPPELKEDKDQSKRAYVQLKNGTADEWDALAKVQQEQIKKQDRDRYAQKLSQQREYTKDLDALNHIKNSIQSQERNEQLKADVEFFKSLNEAEN